MREVLPVVDQVEKAMRSWDRFTERIPDSVAEAQSRQDELEDLFHHFTQDCWHIGDYLLATMSHESKAEEHQFKDRMDNLIRERECLNLVRDLANKSKHLHLKSRSTVGPEPFFDFWVAQREDGTVDRRFMIVHGTNAVLVADWADQCMRAWGAIYQTLTTRNDVNDYLNWYWAHS